MNRPPFATQNHRIKLHLVTNGLRIIEETVGPNAIDDRDEGGPLWVWRSRGVTLPGFLDRKAALAHVVVELERDREEALAAVTEAKAAVAKIERRIAKATQGATR